MGKAVGVLKRGGSKPLSVAERALFGRASKNSDNNKFGDMPHACVLIIFANYTDGGNGLDGRGQWT